MFVWFSFFFCSQFIASSQLYIPKVQTFAITDTVPFFLQLRAPSASLRAFVSQISTNQSQQIAPNLASHLKLKPTVRVFLYRQVRAEIEGQRAWRTIILGEGKLAPLAPTAQFIESCASLDDIESLDWEGEVKCEEEVSVGGFSLEKLVVKVRPLCLKRILSLKVHVTGLYSSWTRASKSSEIPDI